MILTLFDFEEVKVDVEVVLDLPDFSERLMK